MTAPRIIPAAEAAALLEAATPGPWVHNSCDLWHTCGCGGPLTLEADWALAAIAPDLATSVVALHAEVERARRYERIRIADWLRGKSRIGLAEEGLDETGKAVLYALIAYANAIDADRMDE